MKFSIVMPIHNVEAYLEECLDSILSQPFADLEVIAIDDASTDGSAEIADRYAARDRRVRVLHLEHNRGLGPVRNLGMDEAIGDYLLFLDSDDTLTPGALSGIAARLAETGNPDVLVVDHARTYWDGRREPSPHGALLAAQAGATFTVEQCPDILQVLQVAWNKIYRRAFVAELGLRFPTGFYEDTAWSPIVLLSARSLATLPQVCVHYRQRRHGSILTTNSARHFEGLDQWQSLFDHLDERPELARWRPQLVVRAMQHFRTVLTLPHRISRADRPAYFARAADLVRHNLGGARPPVRSVGERVLLTIFLHGNLRAFDLARRVDAGARAAAAAVGAGRAHADTAKGKARTAARLAYYHRVLREPLDERLAVYTSLWDRGVAGNPAAIRTAMHAVAPQLRAVWILRPGADRTGLGEDRAVVPGTRDYYRALATARYVVSDVNLPDFVVKRPGQVHVQTQHGTPLKHMGLDLRRHPIAAKEMDFDKLLRRADRWDYNLSANKFSSLVWQRAFPSRFVTLESGYPRNDVLVNASAEDVRRARDDLGLVDGTVAVLFAPTHREQDETLTFRADVRALADALGPGFTLLVRAHYFYDDMPDLDRLDAQGRIRNVSRAPAVEPLMLAADALLTDYSSIMFDYANLDRPIVSYLPDWEGYRALRGVYFDLTEQPPGEVAYDQAGVVELFTSGRFDAERAAERRRRFRETFCTFDDGRAAERVARVVFLGEDPMPIVPPAQRTPPPRPDQVRVTR